MAHARPSEGMHAPVLEAWTEGTWETVAPHTLQALGWDCIISHTRRVM